MYVLTAAQHVHGPWSCRYACFVFCLLCLVTFNFGGAKNDRLGGYSSTLQHPLCSTEDEMGYSSTRPCWGTVAPKAPADMSMDRTCSHEWNELDFRVKHAEIRGWFPCVKTSCRSSLDEFCVDSKWGKRINNQKHLQTGDSSLLLPGRVCKSSGDRSDAVSRITPLLTVALGSLCWCCFTVEKLKASNKRELKVMSAESDWHHYGVSPHLHTLYLHNMPQT